MEEQDLREIGVSDPQHRRKLLQAARSLPKVMPTALQSAFARARATCPIPPGPRAGSELGSGRADHSGLSALVLGVPEGGRVLLTSLLSPEAQRDSEDRSGLRTGAGICLVWEPGAHRLGPQRPFRSLLNHLRPGGQGLVGPSSPQWCWH